MYVDPNRVQLCKTYSIFTFILKIIKNKQKLNQNNNILQEVELRGEVGKNRIDIFTA